jgi:hypothetical protein
VNCSLGNAAAGVADALLSVARMPALRRHRRAGGHRLAPRSHRLRATDRRTDFATVSTLGRNRASSLVVNCELRGGSHCGDRA